MPPVRPPRRSGRVTFVALAPMLAVALAGGLVWRGVQLRDELATPRDLHGVEHVTSGECARCHPQQFESWARTFHRTMTQEASRGSVLGDFDGARFDYGGIDARMTRTERGGFEMAFYGPEGLMSRAEVVRTVGSHRYQQYLARDDDVLFRLPMAWHVEEGRWFHMNGAFLTPDPPAPPDGGRIGREDYMRHVTRWNDNCVFCHNVAADPGRTDSDTERTGTERTGTERTGTGRTDAGRADTGRTDTERGARWDTTVAELGIACEACHGPAEAHARANADPMRRYALHLSDRPDPTIVNPARLSPERSAEVCGRCHGQRITDDVGRFLRHGDPYVPGDPLEDYSRPLGRDTTLDGEAGVFAARFWADGTPRLTAYEYQGLLQSPCDGLTCTSCHGMHEGDPSGQMRPEARGDAQCTGCHAELEARPAAVEHARHDAVECVDCHMPRVVYGLIGAYRSHRIEVPEPARADRPDACTLCHADRSRAWVTAGAARLWVYSGGVGSGGGGPPPDPLPRAGGGAEPSPVASGVMHETLLAGDPIERSIAAAALGRTEGLRSPVWRARRIGLLLDAMVADPYPAVRRIAWRSLRALAGAGDHDWNGYRPTAGREARARWVRSMIRRLGARAIAPDPAITAALRARAAEVAISIGE